MTAQLHHYAFSTNDIEQPKFRCTSRDLCYPRRQGLYVALTPCRDCHGKRSSPCRTRQARLVRDSFSNSQKVALLCYFSRLIVLALQAIGVVIIVIYLLLLHGLEDDAINIIFRKIILVSSFLEWLLCTHLK